MPSEYCDPAATHLDLTRGAHLDPYSTSTHLDLELDLRLEAARTEVEVARSEARTSAASEQLLQADVEELQVC